MSSALTLGSPPLLTPSSSPLTAPSRLSIEYNGINKDFKFNPTPSESIKMPSPSPLGKPSKELKASSITKTPTKKAAERKAHFQDIRKIKRIGAEELGYGAVFDIEVPL